MEEKINQFNELKEEIDGYFARFIDSYCEHNRFTNNLYEVVGVQLDVKRITDICFEIKYTNSTCDYNGKDVFEYDNMYIPMKYLNDFDAYEADLIQEMKEQKERKEAELAKIVRGREFKQYQLLKAKFEKEEKND